MLKIRLRRMGAPHKPFYRVVVSDSRKATTASAVEELGYYDPRHEPPMFNVERERIDYWVGNGAQMSPTVKRLVKAADRPASGAKPESKNDAQPEASPETSPDAPAEAQPEAS